MKHKFFKRKVFTHFRAGKTIITESALRQAVQPTFLDLLCAWISSSSSTSASPSPALSSVSASASGETSPHPSRYGAFPPFLSDSSQALRGCLGSPQPHHLPVHLPPTHHLPYKPTQSQCEPCMSTDLEHSGLEEAQMPWGKNCKPQDRPWEAVGAPFLSQNLGLPTWRRGGEVSRELLEFKGPTTSRRGAKLRGKKLALWLLHPQQRERESIATNRNKPTLGFSIG